MIFTRQMKRKVNAHPALTCQVRVSALEDSEDLIEVHQDSKHIGELLKSERVNLAFTRQGGSPIDAYLGMKSLP